MKIRDEYTCPLEVVHDVTKGKWKPIIIFQLKNQPCSLSDLRRNIAGISEKMLLEQLGEMREFGLIDKHTYEGYPLRVEYFLTDRGRKMLQAVQILQDIGIEYMVERGFTDILDQKGISYSGKQSN